MGRHCQRAPWTVLGGIQERCHHSSRVTCRQLRSMSATPILPVSTAYVPVFHLPSSSFHIEGSCWQASLAECPLRRRVPLRQGNMRSSGLLAQRPRLISHILSRRSSQRQSRTVLASRACLKVLPRSGTLSHPAINQPHAHICHHGTAYQAITRYRQGLYLGSRPGSESFDDRWEES